MRTVKANSKATEELVLPVPPKLRVVPKTISFDIEEPGILYGETLVIKVRAPTRLDCRPRPSAGAVPRALAAHFHLIAVGGGRALDLLRAFERTAARTNLRTSTLACL